MRQITIKGSEKCATSGIIRKYQLTPNPVADLIGADNDENAEAQAGQAREDESLRLFLTGQEASRSDHCQPGDGKSRRDPIGHADHNVEYKAAHGCAEGIASTT